MSVLEREDNIIVSEEDKRKYRGLTLSNKLKVLLISDVTTDKSAAALDVNIGSMSDPWELPGLAHFCEHMLFMGTEKYPCENEYNKYLSEHSGDSNAYTASNHTNFYFDVAPDAFAGALDRFAQFFISPLFTESGVDREVNAVNSEHEKNLHNDYRRLAQVEKCTSDPNHAFSKFGSGNRETLDTIPKQKGIPVRESLLDFHRTYYSANIMALVVLGKETLDELEELVLKLFSDVKNKDIEVPSWDNHPFTPECCKKIAYILPIKDIRNLSMTFPLPDLHQYYKTSPGHYLGNLIGHEGPGSLLSYLKLQGWVNSLVGGQRTGVKGFSFFVVNVDLTEEGIQHVNDIVTAMFQYLNLMKSNGIQDWIFEECKNINAMNFRFKDKEIPQSYACSVAESIHYYPLKEVLSGGYLLSVFDADLISSVLDSLTPDKIRIGVVGKAVASKVDQKEKWYGTEYSVTDIDEKSLKSWENVGLNEALILPKPNELIPTDFELHRPKETIPDIPSLVCESALHRMWYKLDTEFNLPKSVIYIEFFSRVAYLDPHHTNLLHMFVQLFQDSLNEFAYSAELAGLCYTLLNTKYGLTLKIKGYNDKQKVLLEKIIEKLTSIEIDAQRFEILKDAYVRALRNFSADQPHQHLIYYTSLLLSELGWSKEELLNCVEELTVENLKQFIPRFLNKLFIEFLVHGNMSLEKSKELCDLVVSHVTTKLSVKPLFPSQLMRLREYQLPLNCNYVFKEENAVHKTSAVETLYQFGMMNTRDNMFAELIVQIIKEPAFDELRTKEQLGYIVWCDLRRANDTHGLRIIIQGEKNTDYLDSRIEAFLVKMKSKLETLSDDEFKRHKEALAASRLEKPKKLYQLSTRWWMEISSNHYNFRRDQVEVDYLKKISKEDMVHFYKKFVCHDSEERKKLSIHVESTAPGGAKDPNRRDEQIKIDSTLTPAPILKEAEMIKNIPSFKKSMALHPLMKPYISLTIDSKSKL